MSGLFELRASTGAPLVRVAAQLESVLPVTESRAHARRLRALVSDVSRRYAELVLHGVLERLPDGEEVDDYRRSLRVSKVVGGPRGVEEYAVRSVPARRRLKEGEADVTLVYVYPLRGPLLKRPRWVDVLAARNPWTADTLPVSPRAREATVVLRRAGRGEVAQVRDAQRANAALVREEFLKAGVRLPAKKAALRGVTDASLLAQRLEFGVGGKKSTPHWRPALRRARQTLSRLWGRGEWAGWLWKPGYPWESRAKGQKRLGVVEYGVVKSFWPFARRVAV